MRILLAVLVLAACAAPQRRDIDVPDDLRDAPAVRYPPASVGEAVYRRMLALEPGRATEEALLLQAYEREQLVRHIVRTKGREAYWNWRFELDPGLPREEQDFIRWYLGAYTPYAVVRMEP